MQRKIDRKGKYDEKRPEGLRFHWWHLSRKITNGGKTITIGQLIELEIIMTIFQAMIII